MADGRGGYRQPANPAPVSGPGSLSARTDGGPGDPQPLRSLPNAQYGESAAFVEQQRGAPLEQVTPRDSAAGPAAITGPAAGLTPLDAPSSMPDEPITAGIDRGAGPGSEVLGGPLQQGAGYGSLIDTLSALAPEDNTGVLARLYLEAGRRGIL